ncbi:MAG: hypothetical protein FK730_03195 [Asgard group archaeon]|nr:hypothetical protein [Asgard group archaeon]
MTRLTFAIINCPKCDTSFDVRYNASINTLMNPELITGLLNKELFTFECSKCKKSVLLQTQILINSPKGIFRVDTGSDQDSLLSILREYEIVDDENNVITPGLSIDELLEQHESINENDIRKG